MSKYYAVAQGRKTGVFTTWAECEAQVKGYSNAKYKSFPSKKEAQNFLAVASKGGAVAQDVPKTRLATEDKSGKTIEIYTDGSHFKHETPSYLGFGAWCKYKEVEYELSQECTSSIMKKFGIAREYRTKCSNPTAEFLGFAFALNELKRVRSTRKLRFYIDYTGVENWMTGVHRANEPYIAAIRDHCLELIENYDLKVDFVHVAGHCGEYGNEASDRLAKCREEFNEFPDLLALLRE